MGPKKRRHSSYNYTTKFNSFENVENVQIFINIRESRNLKKAIVNLDGVELAGGDPQPISANETYFEFFGENMEISAIVEIEYDVESRVSWVGPKNIPKF